MLNETAGLNTRSETVSTSMWLNGRRPRSWRRPANLATYTNAM